MIFVSQKSTDNSIGNGKHSGEGKGIGKTTTRGENEGNGVDNGTTLDSIDNNSGSSDDDKGIEKC